MRPPASRSRRSHPDGLGLRAANKISRRSCAILWYNIDKMKFAIHFACLFAVYAAFAEKQPIERYQSIIDRQMFGPLPPGFDPAKSPNDVQKSSSRNEEELTQDQAKLKSAIRFFVIDTKADGTVSVGFADNSDPKAPKSYYLKVGESRDGWEVKKADPETATMTIAKGEIEVSLELGGNSAKGGGTSAAAPAAASASNGLLRRPGLLGGGLMGGTLRARRLQRQQEAQAQAAARQQEAQAQAEAKEAERQAQAEADKQQREAEREEQRKQLLAIQEELKKVREAKAAAAREESTNEGEGNADNDAE